MLNFAAVRSDRIRRLEKKLGRIGDKLKRNFRNPTDMLSILSQYSKIEREIEIQKAYLQVEGKNNG